MNSVTIWELIHHAIQHHLDSLAICSVERRISYQELEQEVENFGRYLRLQGVAPGDRVAILVPRNVNLLISMLGILSVGASYVPLSERYPTARNQTIIDDAECKFIISNEQYSRVKHILPYGMDEATLKEEAHPERSEESSKTWENSYGDRHVEATQDDIAYIIYTSGSTGQPKGVMITHANALSLIEWSMTQFDRDILKYTLASTSICFDLSIFEMFVPLAMGGCVVIVDNVLSLIDTPIDVPLSLINTVPSAIRALLDHGAIPSSVRVINLAGEALEQRLVNHIYQSTSVEKIYNLYGPSETTTYSMWYLAENNVERLMVPIGRPIAGTSIYLLDHRQQPVPPRATGEIYIAGPGVSLGYCRRPDETQIRYVELKIAGKTIRAYRTGDLARLNRDNEYEYLGRIDNQIKLHGFRIEPDEINKVIQSCPGVKQAYIIARNLNKESVELVAYVVLQANSDLLDIQLRQWMLQYLPEYMIPKSIVFLDELPLNSNGKIDQNALPSPTSSVQLSSTNTPTDLETKIFKLWESLLAHSDFDLQSNFFYVGGHSLLAARLLAKYKSEFGIQCHLGEIFQFPTIQEQAKLIAECASQASVSKMIFNHPRPDHIHLSYGQERLWYLHYAMQELPISNIPIVIRMTGQLNVFAFEQSVRKIIERHEILRTIYEKVGHEVVQRVRYDHSLFQLEIERLVDPYRLEEKLEIEANRSFDLTRDLMIRAKQFVLSEEKSILMIVQHHIASDAWSMNILMRELSSLYSTYLHDLPEPTFSVPVQYADYSLWQRGLVELASYQADLDYWKEKLSHAPEPIKLPFDRKRREIQTYSGAFYTWDMDVNLVKQLKLIANQNQCSLFMVLLAGFSILLHRYSEQNDFCIGILSANREEDELSQSLGFFVNTLVTRHQIEGKMSCHSVLSQVRTTVLECLAHQQVPFDKVVEAVKPKRQLNQHPLFDVLFSLQNALDTDLVLEGLDLSVNEYDRKISKFDLTVSLIERKNKLASIFEYNTTLFDETTIARMTKHYSTVLEAMVKDLFIPVELLDIVPLEERHSLLLNINAEQQRNIAECNIVQCFEAIVAKYPSNIAIVSKKEQYTYQELDERASRLAQLLFDYGVTAGNPIGLLFPRCADAIVCMLAVLKVGGYYVPMDPDWPTERLDFILRDVGAHLVITYEKSAMNMPTSLTYFQLNLDTMSLPELNPSFYTAAARLASEDACYAMYTSGSTGKPKGVIATHAGVIRLVKETNYVHLDATQRILQLSPLAFDGSTFDIWGSLLNGSTLVLMPEGLPDLGQMGEHLSYYQISTLFITTQLFNSLVDYKLESLSSLKQVLFGGEVASKDHVSRFKKRYPNCALSNIYGPTECTTFALSYLIPDHYNHEAPLPLGQPITNTCVAILSEKGMLCPMNVIGEICLGGTGLARGYLNQDALTHEKFIHNPYLELKTTRLYKTGDLGYYRNDGQIVFVGRVDSQIKLRGFRIELPEIERALRDLPGILDAVVLLQSPEQCLIAYLTVKSAFELTIKTIKQQLSYRLPNYMLPDGVLIMDAFPLNANGKVDKDKLPKWKQDDVKEQQLVEEFQGNKVAKTIHQIWVEVLGHSHIRSTDNFFEIGGNSLKIILVLEQLQAKYQSDFEMTQKLDIVTLFQYPTIQELSMYLSKDKAEPNEETQPLKRINQRDKRQAARAQSDWVE